jgi:phage gpG-like protein
MFQFDFEVAGELQVSRLFSRFGEKVADITPALKKIRSSFYQIEKKQFSSQGGYGSAGWAPLSEAYAVRKAKLFPGKGILEATGDLRKALTQSGAFGNVDILEHSSLVVGTNIGYAVYHQKGTKKMPQRKPIELPEQERKGWTSILHKHIFFNS